MERRTAGSFVEAEFNLFVDIDHTLIRSFMHAAAIHMWLNLAGARLEFPTAVK
jgi:hypothetical protein